MALHALVWSDKTGPELSQDAHLIMRPLKKFLVDLKCCLPETHVQCAIVIHYKLSNSFQVLRIQCGFTSTYPEKCSPPKKKLEKSGSKNCMLILAKVRGDDRVLKTQSQCSTQKADQRTAIRKGNCWPNQQTQATLTFKIERSVRVEEIK